MEKTYQPQKVEEKIYQFWEKGGYFTPKILIGKKPFTILLPPPNANAPLHMGHAMYVVEDILCRYHRMKGEPTLFLPGTDHAGIETQYVFEKRLAEEGKSRFDFDRETLYQMIKDYVEKNRGIAKKQMKKLGFSLDWTREKYTLEPEILKTVLETFKKLYQDGLIYRGERIVNYCVHCGTAFSELEVVHQEKDEFLYYLDYGPIKIATTRPETIFADVAVAVNPKDKRYKKLIGKKAVVPLIKKEVPIIADQAIEIDFGTGALKVTPAHDQTDFEIGQRHNLPIISCISPEGKMINVPPQLLDLPVAQAKQKTVELLKSSGKLVKIEPLHHAVGHCYRCKNPIEPLLMPQWFIKIAPLAKPAIEAAIKGKIEFFPPRFKKVYLQWMENIRDWNISRQIVWGPQIPVWYCLDCNPEIKLKFLDKNKNLISGSYKELKGKYDFREIKNGLQVLTAPVSASFEVEEMTKCPKCGNSHLLQETDTFDTWFSSGQWPLTTLGYPKSKDFKYFYPTSVLDTMWDILPFWVARMIMFGLYLTGKVPFKVVHLHSRVVDIEKKKMSKSKGNVIDPIEMTEKYGADALRMSLVFGVSPASDVVVTEEKIRAMRNFANKIWNAARFVLTNREIKTKNLKLKPTHPDDKWILAETKKTTKRVTNFIEKYRFDLAAGEIYEFFWHTFCDKYIEMSKKRREEAQPTLVYVLETSLKLLHPFMPFITEEIWQMLPGKRQPLIISPWPK